MSMFAALTTRMGLSLNDAADLLDVRPDTVRSWSSGRRNPPPAVIDELVSLNQAIAAEARTALDEWKKAGEPELWAYDYAGAAPYPRWGEMVAVELRCLLPHEVSLQP